MTGDDVKAWRQRHRMTQQQAATVFLVTEAAVAGWERGRFGIDTKVEALCTLWDDMRPEQRKKVYGRLAKRWAVLFTK